jgi:CAAX prenyl protease-like protein
MQTRRISPSIAHVAPLAVFLVFTSLVPLFAVDNPMLPWWRRAPEQWIYPLQTLVVGALLWVWRREYTFKPVRGVALAALFGLAGFLWWCFPAWAGQKLESSGTAIPSWAEWLGFVMRTTGFDPDNFAEYPRWHACVIFARFLRLVWVVPFAEEIFWRGFLMRYVQADGGDFERIPFGRHSWPAFAITTVAFTFVHGPSDWLGALGFGSLMYFLAVRTKSLAACIAMHAVTNLLLGVYVMATRQWGFW